MKNALLVAAVIIGQLGMLPYMLDIIKRSTKPNLVSWVTWSLLTGVATAAEIGAHQYRVAIFTASATFATTVIVLLGLRHGHVKYTGFDIGCQIGAIVGIILWQLFNSPGLAVFASVAIDLIGALPTLRHSYLKPGEETWQTYAVSAVSASLGIAALEKFNFINLAYPVYLVALTVTLSIIILSRRRILKG